MCRSRGKTFGQFYLSYHRLQLDSDLDGTARLLRSRQRWAYAVSAAGAEVARKIHDAIPSGTGVYVDLCLRDGISLNEAVAQAKVAATQHENAGVNIAALELAARMALAGGAFEEDEEEVPAIVDEFYPEATTGQVNDPPPCKTMGSQASVDVVSVPSKLSDRLGSRVRRETTG